MAAGRRWLLPLLVAVAVGWLGSVDAAITQPDGIEAEEGDAAKFFNMTYSEQQSRLEQKVFQGYRINVRPVRNDSDSVEVKMHWHVIHVSVNPKEQTLTMHGHLYMTWFDEYLVWDSKDFNDIRTIRCRKWQVWQPKVRVINSVSGVNTAFEIASTGHVLIELQNEDRSKIEMYPTFSIKVGCSMDFADFPNDVNSCKIAVAAVNPMTEVQLNIYYSMPPSLTFAWGDQSSKKIISDFNILNVTNDVAYYKHGNYSRYAPLTANEMAVTWSIVETKVVFQRHSPIFFVGILLPCIVCSMFNVLSMLIDSLRFATFALFANFFLLLVFLQDVFSRLPQAVSSVPRPVTYYTFLMLSTTFCLLGHLLIVFLISLQLRVPVFMRHVYRIQPHFPDWAVGLKKGQDESSWTAFVVVVRPILAVFLAFIYFCLYFILLF